MKNLIEKIKKHFSKNRESYWLWLLLVVVMVIVAGFIWSAQGGLSELQEKRRLQEKKADLKQKIKQLQAQDKLENIELKTKEGKEVEIEPVTEDGSNKDQ